jgi:GR25 family glycosyltransferase involved in LPS biosynthesis
MKDIAYLILAHTDPAQLGRLCRALDYRAHIFVHLDAKVDIRPFLAQPLPNSVVFIKDRVRVSWAEFSQVDATLHMMAAALNAGIEFSHLVLLSGLDYPIKPVEQLYAYLNAEPEREFIRFFDANLSDHYRVFFEHYWFLKANLWLPTKFDRNLRHGFGRVLRQFVKKPQPDGMKICWGSAYWALTPPCARYILQYTEQYQDFVNWSKSSFAVDEHYFHTIIGNSRYLENSGGFSTYQGNKTYLMANLHLIHESLRKVYSLSDFDELIQSDKYFVRKVMSEPSWELLNRLDHEVLSIDRRFCKSDATIEGDHK